LTLSVAIVATILYPDKKKEWIPFDPSGRFLYDVLVGHKSTKVEWMEAREKRTRELARELEILSEKDIDLLIEVLRSVRSLKRNLMKVVECKKD